MLVVVPAGAQQYPSKPIRFILPYLPSGPNDLVARMISKGLSDKWGQPVVVENKAGAQGNIGMDLVAKSPADGYTIIQATGFTLTVNPHIYKLPFDVSKDFAPISLLVSSAAVLVVAPTLPVKTVTDLVRLAKARPNELTYGSSGNGGFGHVSGVLLQMLTKTQMTHVPYKSSAPALTDVAAGNISFLFNNLITTVPFVKSGRVRALAVSTADRSSALPDIPTVAEAGVPGYESTTWNALLAPAKTPAGVIEALNLEVAHILNSAEVKDRIVATGGAVTPSTPAELARKINQETNRMASVVRFSGLNVQ
jgi:tripartite-type tricarboxylate transporter receptor subunit TctC